MEHVNYSSAVNSILEFITKQISIFSIEQRVNILRVIIFALRSLMIKYSDYLRSVSYGEIPEK